MSIRVISLNSLFLKNSFNSLNSLFLKNSFNSLNSLFLKNSFNSLNSLFLKNSFNSWLTAPSWHQRADVAESAALLVVVEAVADDEVVGDLEGRIADVERRLQLVGLDEEGADADGGGMAGAYLLDHAPHGAPRVDDVLDDDDVAAREVLVDAHHLLDLTCRRGALIGGQLDEGDLAGDGDAAHQVGREDEGAVEDGQQQRVAALEVVADLPAQLADAPEDVGLGDGRLECLVDNRYSVHILS